MFEHALKEFGYIDSNLIPIPHPTLHPPTNPPIIVCPSTSIYDPHCSNFWHPPGSPASRDPIHTGRYATLDINLTHPIRSTQLALSHFLHPRPGTEEGDPKREIIISSIAAQINNLNIPLYVAAKHALSGFIRSLTVLEHRFGIRVNGVAPGVIKTPLWTEHPEKLAFVDPSVDVWASPEEVAEAMFMCLEDGELGGGKILEVGAGQTRVVGEVMDAGPGGRGCTVGRGMRRFMGGWGWRGGGERGVNCELGRNRWGLRTSDRCSDYCHGEGRQRNVQMDAYLGISRLILPLRA